MRICLLHPYVWPEVRRGGERYLDDLATYLRSRGHDVHLIVGTHGERGDGSGATKLRHLPSPPRVAIGEVETFGLRALPTLVRHRRFDLVHALTPSGTLAARSAGHRTVYTLLGHPSPQAIPRTRTRRRVLRVAVRRAHTVTVLSETAARALHETYGRAAAVVPPGVFLDRFPASLEPRTGPPTILFASALDRPQKGLDVLVAAFGIVLENRPEARLQLSGPGDPDHALSGVGARLLERIEVLGVGSPDEVPGRYSRAHVTVLPSRNEAFGLVLAESLACGTPVVGTFGGGGESIVDDDRVGRLIPYGDAPRLAAAIIECIALATDPRTPEACRVHATRWAWNEAVGPAHERVYEDVTGGSPRDGLGDGG